jgi:hypothetical protein
MTETNEPDCGICSHAWEEHDGMGDCHHPDARTFAGYCAGHEAWYHTRQHPIPA